MRQSLSKQAGLLTASRAFAQVLNALAGILVVRQLSQFDYGTYRQVILLFSTLVMLGDAAFSQSLFYFVPRNRTTPHIFVGQALLATLFASFLWAGALVGFSGPIAQFFGNPELVAHMVLLSLYLGLSLLSRILETSLITLERVGLLSGNTAVFEAMKALAMVAVVWKGGGVAALLWAMVIVTALRVFHLLHVTRESVRLAVGPEFGSQFRYSMALWLPGLLNASGMYAHQYIVGHYFSPDAYAIYAVACFQIPLLGPLASSVLEVFLVRATSYWGRGQRAEVLQIWREGCRKALMLFVPATVLLAVLAVPLITLLFTRRYLASAPLFALIVLSMMFYGLLQDAIFRACSAMRAYSFFYFLRVVLGISLGLVGVKFFGLWGAAVSTLLTIIVVNIWQLVQVGRLLQVPFSGVLPWRDVGKIFLVSLLAALPAAACGLWIPWAWIALGAGSLLFGAVYVFAGLRSGLIRAEELRYAMEYLHVPLVRSLQAREKTAG